MKINFLLRVFSTGNWSILVVLALFFLGLDAVPLTDIDEGAFAEASREMLARGDWVSPWLLDVPRFDKPALIHWLQMTSFSIFGVNVWAARLPSALAGVVWVWAIASWAQTIANRSISNHRSKRVRCYAAIIAGVSVGILGISRASTADALLNALIALTLLAIWSAFYSESSFARALMRVRVAAFCVGLGLLTKGPIALIVPGVGMVIAAASLGQEGWTRFWSFLRDPWSWLMLGLVAGPWYWLQFQVFGHDFLQGFFGTHNLGRYTSTMHGFSSGPWYYPVWTIVALFPWVPITVWAVYTLCTDGLWRQKNLWMCWGVFLFVLVFFSFSATKLPHYGFYGLSGFLVIIGILVEQAWEKHGRSAPVFIAQSIFTAVATLGVCAAPLWWKIISSSVVDPYYRDVFLIAGEKIIDHSWWFILPTAVCLCMFLWRRIEGVLAASVMLTASLYFGIVMPLLEAYRAPIVGAALIIREIQEPVFTWRLSAPSLSFEAQRTIKPGNLLRGRFFVMYVKDHKYLVESLKYLDGVSGDPEIVWSQGGLQIVRIS